MQGLFELRTPVTQVHANSGRSRVVGLLQETKYHLKLSLKESAVKLCALLLIVSAQRVQNVHLVKMKLYPVAQERM